MFSAGLFQADDELAKDEMFSAYIKVLEGENSSSSQIPRSQFHVCGTKHKLGAGAILLVCLVVVSSIRLWIMPQSSWRRHVAGGLLPNNASSGIIEQECALNIILARHCNKRPPWDVHPTPIELCTSQGLLRGENMARIFGPDGIYPTPTKLFAREISSGYFSSRDLYLLWPLAQRLQLIVNTSFAAEDAVGLVNALLSERQNMCSQTVLIAWDHCSIPAIAQGLGCNEGQCLNCWDDDDYDSMLVLRHESTPSQDWRVSLNVSSEGFQAPTGLGGYRECTGNPVESSKFGFPCKPLPGWKSLVTQV